MRREQVDARVTNGDEEKGILIVFTSSNEGKSLPRFGLTRAVGHTKRWNCTDRTSCGEEYNSLLNRFQGLISVWEPVLEF